MQSQQYQPKAAVATISNAMDVGNPSNFVRILELFHQQFPQLKEKFSSVSITDEETKQTMKQVYDELQYTLDPHGAVGYLALERYLSADADSQQKGIFLETAHPVKFYDVVEPVLNQTIPLPDAVKEIIDLPKNSTVMDVSFEALRDYLLKAV